jgi:hypothetical protein
MAYYKEKPQRRQGSKFWSLGVFEVLTHPDFTLGG